MNKYTLKLDFDFKPKNLKKFAEEFVNKLDFIRYVMGIYVESVEVYETSKGLHIYVYVFTKRQLTNQDIVVLQLALGSDYKRELFNWVRVRQNNDIKHWNILFRRKYENGKLVSMERATDMAIELTKLINHLLIQE